MTLRLPAEIEAPANGAGSTRCGSANVLWAVMSAAVRTRPVTEAALKVDLSKGPVVVGLALPDGYAVIRVLKSTPKPQDGNDALQAKNLFTGAFEESEAEAVYNALKARYKVKYYDDRIAKVTSEPASAAD